MERDPLHEPMTGTKGTPGRSTTERLHAQSAAARDDLRDLGNAAEDFAREKLGQAREAAADYYEIGKKKASEWENVLVDYVRRQPVKSLLIVAGAGLVLGMLLRRR
jgi:ElaB/YqjD/DUF883 family membrane-anchored ribosome-binding protein